ncbi:unnamed protein product [Victoria cruziana]
MTLTYPNHSFPLHCSLSHTKTSSPLSVCLCVPPSVGVSLFNASLGPRNAYLMEQEGASVSLEQRDF